MSGATGAAVIGAELRHSYPRASLHVVAVEFLCAWQKQYVTASVNKRRAICIECARVGVEVFVSAELQRIDENAHDDEVVFGACAGHERQMTCVQVAHGRNEAECATCRVTESRLKRLDSFKCLHF